MEEEKYGTSPALLALPQIRDWNNLSDEEKAEAATVYMEWLMRPNND